MRKYFDLLDKIFSKKILKKTMIIYSSNTIKHEVILFPEMKKLEILFL